MDDLEATIAQVSAEVAARLRPFEVTLVRWDAIPGVGHRTAEAVLAEIGTDMGRFPTSDHLVSWAGMCPGNDESAGKRKRSKTRTGNAWLRAALIEAAHAAGRTKGTSLGAQYQRLAARRGTKRAAVAVGRRSCASCITWARRIRSTRSEVDGSWMTGSGPRSNAVW